MITLGKKVLQHARADIAPQAFSEDLSAQRHEATLLGLVGIPTVRNQPNRCFQCDPVVEVATPKPRPTIKTL